MNELSLLKVLLDELLAGIQEILQSGETLSDQFQGLLADEIEATVNRIDQLRQIESEVENLPPGRPPEPQLSQGYPSSNIHSFGYDEDNGRLLVKFQGNGNYGEGPIYGYDGIPKVIFDLFQKGAIPARTDGQNKWGKWWKGKVPSLGASLYTLIRNGGYPYQRLT